jgi:hypothetical protein
MRSLRPLHENRARGPQNFRNLLQNDFCNTIRPIADIVRPLPVVWINDCGRLFLRLPNPASRLIFIKKRLEADPKRLGDMPQCHDSRVTLAEF